MTRPDHDLADIAELRKSVDLESRADLMAMACNFSEAARLMKQANAIRKWVFGAFDPNELRDRTHAALSGESRQ